MSTQETPRAETPAAADVRIPPAESPRHEEGLLDQALAETFPASDPISPAVESRLGSADARWGRRLRRAAPSLVALGAAAIVLLATRPRRPRVQ